MVFHEVAVLVDRIPMLFVCGYWILYSNVAMLKLKWRQIILLISLLLAMVKISISNNSIAARYDNLLFGIEPYHARRDDITPLLNR